MRGVVRIELTGCRATAGGRQWVARQASNFILRDVRDVEDKTTST